MTLKEVIELGYTKVIVKASGYQETGVLGCWQPFRNIRSITFSIDPEFIGLDHKTFWVKRPKDQDYYIEDGQAILYEPDLYANCY